MFEFSVALKYLLPRWRQLSVSIISLISVLVIALVVWLILLFFSVTNGLEKIWVEKLIALTAPVRMTPTEDYYKSYYFQSDALSAGSDYTLKSLREKLAADETDSYDPLVDEELPHYLQTADRHADGTLKDLAKEAYSLAKNLKGFAGLAVQDYEMTFTNFRLRLLRNIGNPFKETQAFLTQGTYLGTFDQESPLMQKTILPLTKEDMQNILSMLQVAPENNQESNPESILKVESTSFQKHLETFFDHVEFTDFKVGNGGWVIPHTFFDNSDTFQGLAILKNQEIQKIILPQNISDLASLEKSFKDQRILTKKITVYPNKESHSIPLILAEGSSFTGALERSSLKAAKNLSDVYFQITLPIQGKEFSHRAPMQGWELEKMTIKNAFSPYWVSSTLPSDSILGDGILAPKSFQDAGALVGDRGYLSYYTPTTSTIQEQRITVFIAGFYDPGVIPIGGKYLLSNADVTSQIRSSHNQEDTSLSNGFNVRFEKISDAKKVKEALVQALKEAKLDRYWKVETYREYEFTKDLIQQLGSEKTIFTLISTIIIIVACSNIVSMLIILVNDKKTEIGILRSMGASSFSIGAIFGICGMVMGAVGSILGVFLALLTLRHLDVLIGLISKFQGYEAFNPLFYGKSLPHEISYEALFFVVAATILISLLSGIVPAIKACTLNPSKILRSE